MKMAKDPVCEMEVDKKKAKFSTVKNGKNVISAHVKVSDKLNNQKILDEINKILKEKHNIYFSTVQLEEKCYDLASKEIDFT